MTDPFLPRRLRRLMAALLLGVAVGACSQSSPPPPGHAELDANFTDYTSFQQATIDMQAGHDLSARARLTDLVARYPAADRARRLLHNSYLRTRAWEPALALYDSVDASTLTGPERNHLAELASQLGKLDYADHLVGDLADGPDADVRYVITKSLILFERGDLAGADSLITPRWPEVRAKRAADAHWVRGCTLLHLGRLDEARTVLEEAIEINPRYWPAYYAMARTLSEQGRKEEAAEYFATFERESAEQHRQTTVRFWMMGRSLEAQEAIERRAFSEAIPIIESMIEKTESDSLKASFLHTLSQVRAESAKQSQGTR